MRNGTETGKRNEEKEKRDEIVEIAKLHYDFLKHFSTLNTALLVILAAFVYKLEITQWRFLVLISSICFLISLICCFIGMYLDWDLIGGRFRRYRSSSPERPKFLRRIKIYPFVYIAMATFALGTSMFVIFLFKNLY
jgi:amino acid transporter